ncbi:MAG TPA: DNA mismatch repair endonuclease MutL, partial [Myxococcota bacterium]|nr:DNA mismatch repair endonuclease MutL [Myxococcota bacterium]
MVAEIGREGEIQTESRAESGTGGTPRVRLLPDPLIDQIAAGEVVERPASVVKELVENAVDAGATRVRVEVREGGTALIAVTDDGQGMGPEDARLALQRHATSKLASFEDLQGIRSFGFRGEALPAIAAVSRLRLQTRPRGAEEAFELIVVGGERIRERATGAPPGTRVEVAELFAQVPARRKFLRSASTEWGHVSEWLVRAALAWPGIHFDIQRDDRTAIAWPAATEPLDRIAAVLSEE